MRHGFFIFFLLSSLILLPTQLFADMATYLMLWKLAELEAVLRQQDHWALITLFAL